MNSVDTTPRCSARCSDPNGLYSPQTVTAQTLTPAVQEQLLANDFPALTFAAGHRGVQKIRDDYPRQDIDIRLKYAVGKPLWPRGTDDYEWQHSDIYSIAYPYLFGLYGEWKDKGKGVAP